MDYNKNDTKNCANKDEMLRKLDNMAARCALPFLTELKRFGARQLYNRKFTHALGAAFVGISSVLASTEENGRQQDPRGARTTTRTAVKTI